VLIFEEYYLLANLNNLIAWIAGRTTRHMEPNSVFSNTVLEGRVALITGGGSGIGLEIATQFGKHGAKVAIMGRRQQVLDAAVSYLESHGVEVLFFIFREASFLERAR
jgi:FlaA1/EpsC-like NDP-sugar epimerase